MLATFQNINNGNNAQLSPRQPNFGQQAPQGQQPATQQWTAQQANNVRLTLQQTNPMLNAQLTVSVSILRILKYIKTLKNQKIWIEIE